MNIARGMGAGQPIGDNTLLSSLVHVPLKRQVVLGKQEKAISPLQSWRSKNLRSDTI
jgi:hypothetical protein